MSNLTHTALDRATVTNSALSFGARGLYAVLRSLQHEVGDRVTLEMLKQYASTETDEELTGYIGELAKAGLIEITPD